MRPEVIGDLRSGRREYIEQEAFEAMVSQIESLTETPVLYASL
jgi:hypothetical protein